VPTGASQRFQRGDLAGHAQVDEARRRAGHDDVARLDVEVDDALVRQVVQHRAEVECKRHNLLEDQPVAADQCGEPRALDELEHQMRTGPVQIRAERAHQKRMGQPLEQARLVRQRASSAGGVRMVWTQQLGDDQGPQALVPGQPGLVAVAAAQQADGLPTWADLTLRRMPSCPWTPMLRRGGEAAVRRG
jgi:hypothetical protein